MLLLKTEENAIPTLSGPNQLLISLFSAVQKGNINRPANFSGLIVSEKRADLYRNALL